MTGGRKLPGGWKQYFPKERIQQKGKPVDWEKRVFVDGGTLDNKPFGYAIEALAQKQANVLIDRKLIYIEPKPDLDGGNQRIEWIERPNVFRNTLDIVTALPGYETIREDLHRVLERNRLIEKVNYIVSNAQKDEYRLLDLTKHDLKKVISENQSLGIERRSRDWADLTIAEIARFKGQAIYPYYRLRMSALTDDLARLSTRRAGVEDDSDYYLAIRSLVRAWRLKNYNKDEDSESPNSIPQFLYDYDFNYRLRRLRFVLQEADKLLSALDKIHFDAEKKNLKSESFVNLSDEELKKDKFSADLKLRYDLTQKIKQDGIFLESVRSKESVEILRQKFALIEDELFDSQADSPIVKIFEAEKGDLEPIIRNLKKAINNNLKELSARQQLIETRSIDTELSAQSKELNEEFAFVANKLTLEDLSELLGENSSENPPTEFDLQTSSKKGKEFLEKHPDINQGIENIARSLRELYNGGTENTAENRSLFGKARQAKNVLQSPSENTNFLENAVCGYLNHFYENFESYDQIIFPITYETPIGEGDVVEVARISPADAVNLIDEENDDKRFGDEKDCKKSERLKKKVIEKRRKLAGNTFFSFSAFFNDKWRKNDIMWGRLDAVERLAQLIITDDKSVSTTNLKEIFITKTQREILKKNEELFPHKTPDDLVEFVRCDYDVDRTLNENSMTDTTARSFRVVAKVLRSPNDIPNDKNADPDKFKGILRFIADFIDSAERIISTSSFGFSAGEIFSFLLKPFRRDWLTAIPFILLFIWFLGVYSIIYSLLTDISGNSEMLNGTYKWILGLGLAALFSYLTLFGIVKLKNYIFSRIKSTIFNFLRQQIAGKSSKVKQ